MIIGFSSSTAPAGVKHTMAAVQQGKRIYREGLLNSGKPISAKTQGNMEVSGQYLACINCHRRSGFGSYEGGVQIPPIAGRILFPTQTDKSSSAQQPNSHTEASLKQAIRTGITADGRKLNPAMPRYELQDRDLDTLIAYLKTLSVQDSPGADAQSLHFATVVSDGISPKRRELMLELMRKYFAPAEPNNVKKMEPIQTPQSRAAMFQNMRRLRIPNYFPSRKLELHVWELKGPSSGWTKQLERYYREQPVFAVLGGLAEGSWQPVHEFCEHKELPCLFPNTVEPVIDEHDFYNVYFTKGLNLEGESVAKHLEQSGELGLKVLQVFRQGDSLAQQAAKGLREEAAELGLKSVHDHAINSHGPISIGFWQQLLQKEHPDILVLWLKPSDLTDLKAIDITASGIKHLYLSATLSGTISPPYLSEQIQPMTYLTHRYLIPGTPAYAQVDSFMASNAADIADHTDDRWLIGDTLWSMSLISEATRQMKYNNRELLVEMVEMFVSRKPPLLYPRLGLAADQRFASKGCFVVQPNKPELAEWIVP